MLLRNATQFCNKHVTSRRYSSYMFVQNFATAESRTFILANLSPLCCAHPQIYVDPNRVIFVTTILPTANHSGEDGLDRVFADSNMQINLESNKSAFSSERFTVNFYKNAFRSKR